MHRCKSVGQNRHVPLPCMPHEPREVRMLSLRQNKNSSFPGHAPGKDTLRAANAATERGLTGENARANAVSGKALSPVKIKIPVASADMRRHSDTLIGAQRRRKRGSRGENNRTSFLRSKVVVFPSFPERGGQRGRKRVKRKRLPVVVPVIKSHPISTTFPVLADS